MFYTRPVLNFESQYREPDDSATVPLGEIMRSQTAADLAAGQIGSRSLNLTSVYDDHNAKVKGLMGVDLPNPAKQTFGYFADPAEKDRYRSDLSSYRDDGGSGSDSAFHASWVEKNYRRQLEELAAKRPDLRAELLPDESFESQSFARRRSVEDQAAAVWERSDKGPLAWAASIAGSAWAGVQDPTNWITAPFGFGGVGTGIKGIAMGFLKNGTANAAVEASIQPFIQAQRDEAGQTSGFDQAAMAVGGAFVLGGAIDATIRGTARTLRYGFGYEPVVKDGIVVAYRKPKADGTVTEIKAETISKADAGDAASIREVAEKSGLSNDPVVKTTLDAMDANEILAAKPSDRISDTDHATATTQALRHVADPDNEPLPVIFEGASPSKLSEIEADLTEARTFLAQASAAAGQMQGAAPEIVSRVQEAQARLTSRVSELEASRETMRQEIMSDELIEMVDGGTVPPDLANVVVSHVGDKSIQGRIAQDLLTRKPASPTEARYQIAELLQSPDYRAPVKDLGPEPAGLPTRALDDPYGPDALKQVAYYEAKYAEELGIAKKPVERAQSGRTGEAANVTAEPQPPAVPPAELISEAINEALALAERILPEGSRVEVTPDLMVTAGGATIDAVQIAGNIRLAAYAIDPAARIGHEGVHVLVTRGLISPAEVGLLANAARKSGAFNDASEAAYREAYAGRADLDRLIDEEAAAHFVEANVRADPAVQGIVDRIKAFIERLRNGIASGRFATAEDISQLILGGEAAQREAVRAWMRDPETALYKLSDYIFKTSIDDLALRNNAVSILKVRPWSSHPGRVLAFHGTEAKFDTFDLAATQDFGLHFGTADQANQFASGPKYRSRRSADGEAGRVIPVVLDLERVIDLKDLGDWRPPLMKSELERVGIRISSGASAQFDRAARLSQDEPAYRILRDDLTRQGYDGIRYLNDAEGKGVTWSYIVWEKGKVESATSGDVMFALREDQSAGQSMRRALDDLGYYSGALEAAKNLRQAKGTPEQMLVMLGKEGAKPGEISATGLDKFVEGKKSVTKDEIIKHLEDNKVKVNEASYGETPEIRAHAAKLDALREQMMAIQKETAARVGHHGGPELNNDPRYMALVEEFDQLRDTRPTYQNTKWSAYSLDPSNPTYRETVLHLPGAETLEQYAARMGQPLTNANRSIMQSSLGMSDRDFQSGHFSEPNIIGHMMTSMTKHEGKPVYTIDQIQSDWGQKLRDGGVRDEAKIRELKRQLADKEREFAAIAVAGDVRQRFNNASARIRDLTKEMRPNAGSEAFYKPMIAAEEATLADILRQHPRIQDVIDANNDILRVKAELATAKSTSPGHPLVNTTDQWTNTTLRRAIRQAAESDAEYIAIPSGKTVLSYNPGDEHGMGEFYNKIVPKNLKNLLTKIDRETPAPQRIETLDSPSGKTGLGKGFTLFKLTDKVKQSVIEDGQAMFALRDSFGKFKVGSKERTENLQMDFANIEADFQRTMLQDPVGYAAKQEAERVKVQQKRAALLNAKANEIVLDDVNGYKDPRGRSDPAKAFMLLHESFGDGVGADLKNARDVIHNTALEMMAKPLWFMRKGAITGDKRRTGKLVGNTAVKTTMHNMVREAAGEDTGDAMAKTFAKAWLDTAEYLRQRFNAAGGDIGKLKSWIMPQYHDPAALIKMKMQNWTDYMMRDGVLDRDAMVNINTGKPFTDTDLRNALHYVWKQITSDGQYAKEVGQGGGGKGAMYKRHADHRFIHFKDADAWIKYQTEVGGGDLYAAMIGHISSMSRDIAAMERFGANPELVRQRVKEQIIKDAGQAQSAKSMFDELKEKLDTLTAQYNSTPTKFEAIMNQISAVHTELDAVRSKYAPQLGGKPSKRNKGKIDKLQEQLFDLHNQMRDAMGKNTLTPEHRALSSEISSLLDEMSGIDLYPVMSRDPLQRAQRILKRSDEIWKSYIGTSNVPADGLTADAMTVLRNWISASSLVFAPFSAVTDQSTQLGARLFVGMPATRQLISFVKGFTPADRQAALAAGLGLDQAANAFQEQARFLGRINTRQLSGYIADRSHAYSGLTPMTQASKIGFGLDYMRWMVGLKDTAFNDLPDAAAAMLKRHGMTKADWTALQTATPETVNGFPMLTRKAIAETAGDDIAEKYMTMLYRERSHAVIEGTMRGRTSIVSDAQPGSITGEGLRSIAMLKSFPITYGLMIIGRFYRTLLEGRTESAMAYGAAIFIVGTMLGALAKQLKNVGQGRDPEDMTNPNFWAAAFMQSGGAGIFGDFVASGVNRFGSGFATTLAGPVFDRVGTLRDLTVGNAMQYASDEKTNTGRELTKVIRQNTPGMFAPWYVRTLYERMIIDELQKQIDPEAHKSFRSKINGQKKRAGNDFFHPPGQPYAARGPNFGAAFGN